MVGEIRIEGVVKRFPRQGADDIIALSGIDLTIGAGEFISLIGPSGCGKSTLLRLIAGLNGADAGRLLIDGEEIRKPHYERGLVFQNPMLFPWLNLYDNVAFGLRARRLYKQNRAEVNKFLDLVGLSAFHKSYPHQLSGGMAQRASLARALVNHPKVLLLDEPLGALDAFTRMNMQDELIRIWQEQKNTMIMVTHDVDEAIYLSDRIIVMTPRPAKIESCIPVRLSRPRARGNPEFLQLRSKILGILNFAGSVKEPNYYL
ncbi:putative ABC transporter ATP-binding protein MJ0412 [Propionispora sp. 2/2-37]|uniref:ABC transporter ATP-binding protein n=1 Tax=Propionispora sp. 2/2-37 TaxID=1677858 RepID=UPI0006BB6E27|nr:ABC transporter ATP-binding protein [Propionispora sp. 2/2-37]CUH97025.1 putative ABC transporter ATP-binding protein MJ0412 [Propionispora sp. 2/2-37]